MAIDVLELLSLVILVELGSLTYFKNPDFPFLVTCVQIKIVCLQGVLLSQKEIDKHLQFPNQTRFNDVYLHISQIEEAPQLAQISIAYEFLPQQDSKSSYNHSLNSTC